MSQKMPVWSWRQAIEKAPITDDGIRPYTKLLLYTISNDVSDCGKFSRKTIAELQTATGLSKSAVIEHIKRAKSAGFLDAERSRNGAGHVVGTRYYPTFPAGFELPTGPANNDEDRQSRSGGLREKKAGKAKTQSRSDGPPKSFCDTSPCTPYIDTFPQTLPIEEARAHASPVDNSAHEDRVSRAQQLRAIAANLRSAERPNAERRQNGAKAITPVLSGLSPCEAGMAQAEPRQEGVANACLPNAEPGKSPANGLAMKRFASGEGGQTSNVRNTERLERWVGRRRRELATVMARPPDFAVA